MDGDRVVGLYWEEVQACGHLSKVHVTSHDGYGLSAYSDNLAPLVGVRKEGIVEGGSLIAASLAHLGASVPDYLLRCGRVPEVWSGIR